jgi:UMP-CMP kinase
MVAGSAEQRRWICALCPFFRQQQATKTTVVFVLGGPGSGKGTQCSKLVSEFSDIAHFSAGDLLRAHVKSGSEEGNKVAEMMQQGQIVPSSVTVGLLQEAKKSSTKTKFIIDGIPRNLENQNAFEVCTGRDCDFVMFFDCPEEVMEQRLLGRNEGRADDNIETIKKRFKVFVESSMPVIEHYSKLDKLYKIMATRSPEDVYTDVRRLFL